MQKKPEGGFHLEIKSLEEFVQLCALIRGEKLDDATLSGLTAKLGGATKEFLDAEAKAKT